MPRQTTTTTGTVNINYDIPLFTWLRLRHYAKHAHLKRAKALEVVLRQGLDRLGVPKQPMDIVRPGGRGDE